jgi:Heparinase II/III-like protein/Heparinase II/III N-terminus
MRFIRILKRESSLVVAREALWRVHKEWNKRRMFSRLERLGHVRFRGVPYYNPDLQTLNQHSRSLIAAFADDIRAGRYRFLGYGTADLGTCPKWNFDFTCGVEWPYVRLKGRECVRCDGSDVKVPYELSRLQFLPVLGKAHVLTDDDSYRRAARNLLSHWIQSNPFPVGVNWTIAMEAALRAMSICCLLNLLSPFRREEQAWLATATRSLVQHLTYIEANIEFSHLLTSNHYLSDVVGLYCLSVFLDGEGMAAKRREYRLRIETEIAKQVYKDGGDYEASTGYQVLVTQLFTTALLLMRAERSASPAPMFLERLRMMFRFLNTVAGESGELPQVGDCDDGRTELLIDDLQQMILCPRAERNSLRIPHLLGLGRRLFGEGTGPGDDAAWYGLTNTTKIPYSNPTSPRPAVPIKVLRESGIGVIQHGSADLLFFAIPNGIYGRGSHTHNDKLSFVLRVGGQEVICDSGTGCYTRDIAARNRFRSTAAHNTLMIDGTEQNRIAPGPLGLFVLGNEATVTPIREGRKAQGRFLCASHSGYASLGVTHTRTIHAVDDERSFVIEDELDGDGVHDFELNLQLAPNRTAEIAAAEDGIVCRILGDRLVQLAVSGPTGLHGSLQLSLISYAYNVTIPAMKVRICGRAAVPTRITTRISWADVTDAVSSQSRSTKATDIRDSVPRGSVRHELR